MGDYSKILKELEELLIKEEAKLTALAEDGKEEAIKQIPEVRKELDEKHKKVDAFKQEALEVKRAIAEQKRDIGGVIPSPVPSSITTLEKKLESIEKNQKVAEDSLEVSQKKLSVVDAELKTVTNIVENRDPDTTDNARKIRKLEEIKRLESNIKGKEPISIEKLEEEKKTILGKKDEFRKQTEKIASEVLDLEKLKAKILLAIASKKAEDKKGGGKNIFEMDLQQLEEYLQKTNDSLISKATEKTQIDSKYTEAIKQEDDISKQITKAKTDNKAIENDHNKLMIFKYLNIKVENGRHKKYGQTVNLDPSDIISSIKEHPAITNYIIKDIKNEHTHSCDTKMIEVKYKPKSQPLPTHFIISINDCGKTIPKHSILGFGISGNMGIPHAFYNNKGKLKNVIKLSNGDMVGLGLPFGISKYGNLEYVV